MNKTINIAIDGPSGAGKSSLAKRIAKELGYIYVDTGAMYRSIALFVMRRGISFKDADTVVSSLSDIQLSIAYIDGNQRVILNGEDVSDYIRTSEISMGASDVSAIPEVRAFLLETQRQLAREKDVVMDGRDIATVILPDADVKIFLTASDECRAMRRRDELVAKGIAVTYEEVLSDMRERDRNDSTRAVAPAVAAPDATLFDNSGMTPEECTAGIIKLIKEKTAI